MEAKIRKHSFTFGFCLLLASLAVAGPCMAQNLVSVHGNAGHIEYPDRLLNP